MDSKIKLYIEQAEKIQIKIKYLARWKVHLDFP